MTSYTKTKVVLDRDEYTALLYEARRDRRTAIQMRAANSEVWHLLMAALHDLAAHEQAHDHVRFARNWIHNHRRPDNGGVPVERRAT